MESWVQFIMIPLSLWSGVCKSFLHWWYWNPVSVFFIPLKLLKTLHHSLLLWPQCLAVWTGKCEKILGEKVAGNTWLSSLLLLYLWSWLHKFWLPLFLFYSLYCFQKECWSNISYHSLVLEDSLSFNLGWISMIKYHKIFMWEKNYTSLRYILMELKIKIKGKLSLF